MLELRRPMRRTEHELNCISRRFLGWCLLSSGCCGSRPRCWLLQYDQPMCEDLFFSVTMYPLAVKQVAAIVRAGHHAHGSQSAIRFDDAVSL